MIRTTLILAFAGALAGCATTQQPSFASFTVTTDAYCRIATKRTWSTADTEQTIDEARRDNAKFDKLCGVKTTKS